MDNDELSRLEEVGAFVRTGRETLDLDAWQSRDADHRVGEWCHRGRRLAVSWCPVRARKDVYVSGDLPVYYEEGNPRVQEYSFVTAGNGGCGYKVGVGGRMS